MSVKETSQTQTSMRPFEALGCSGFHLSQYTPAMANIFGIENKYLALSNGAKETRELLDYYLEHDNERKAIALAGQKFVYTEHTYKRRVYDILIPLL